ncbi:MAG: helix-turn-helix transcriptional regulator [Caldilineaceae bacterium]|nr:helix-turn-helix transcriptional regulator [Caldilineaceae bacterium]
MLRIKDMSVADLSRLSGVSESALSNILSGARKQPRSDTVQKIARAFPTSASYLNGDTNDWMPSDAPPLPDFAAEVVEFMRKLDRGRNYELLLIAQSFVDANEEIRQITRQEFANMLLDASDELGGEEDTNRVMELLQRLERKWTDSDTEDSTPLLPGGE